MENAAGIALMPLSERRTACRGSALSLIQKLKHGMRQMFRHKPPLILLELCGYPLDTWNLVVGITLISHTNGERQAAQIKDLFRWRHAD